MRDLLSWYKEKNVYGVDRWGEHQHYNSNLTVKIALKLADEIL